MLPTLVCALLTALVLASPALAANGGEALPKGSDPVDPVVETTPPLVADTESQLLPALPPPSMPALAAVRRRDGDPVVVDLAPLFTPSVVVATGGRLLVTRFRGGRSELVDVTTPGQHRILLSGTRRFGVPHGGRDADGRAVVVLSPCAGDSAVTLGGQQPRCPLRAVDVLTGSSRPLSGTTGAIAGDVEGAALSFTRGSVSSGVRLYRATVGGAARTAKLPVSPVSPSAARGTSKPVAGTLRVSALDTDGGRLALVADYRDGRKRAVSELWLHTGASWRRLTAVASMHTGQGSPHVLGPTLSAAGVTAYVEGVVDRPSFVGRWAANGALETKLSLRRSIGRATILHGAAIEGDRLVFVDWLPGVPCGGAEAPACGLRSVGPLGLG